MLRIPYPSSLILRFLDAVPELAEQAIHLVDALLRRMHILQERRAQAFEDTAAGGVVRRKIGGELPFREPGIRQKERDPEGARLLVGKLALRSVRIDRKAD